MVNFKKKLYRKFISFLIIKSDWVNQILNELIFNRNFVPQAISERKYFSKWESLGYHISLNHFYHPIPDLSKITDNYWEKEFGLSGVKQNIEQQLKLLSEIKIEYAQAYNSFPVNKEDVINQWDFFVQNNNFTSVDSEVLYSFIKKYKPKKIIEIGSGYSSFLISKTIIDEGTNKVKKPEFISIEPFPRDFFKTDIPGLDIVIEKFVQDVDLSLFESLNENDILFIDSTHVLKYNSDVEFEIFQILPLLKKGVIIHFHDIFFPKNYPKKWIVDHGWFWNEQQFLQAFLMYNDSFEILWSSSILHCNKPELLKDAFSSYSNQENPGSLWIKKIK